MLDSGDSPSPTDLTEKMEAFKERCRRAGLKVTPQRMAVFRMLIDSKEHPSAETVFRQVRMTFPNISMDTVSRTLHMLSENGLAFTVAGSGGAKRFDANLQPHHHFKCTKCQRIIDFFHEPFDNIDVPESVKLMYTISKKTVYLEGICDKCREK